MSSYNQNTFLKRVLVLFCCAFLLLGNPSKAQEMPPRPIALQVIIGQGLIFGAFYSGTTGGTVTVSSTGSRSTTGSIIPITLGSAPAPAIIQVKGNIGTLVTISNGTDVSLTGSSAGSINLHLESSYPTSPFIINTANWMDIRIGGTLTVGVPGSNPPGSYNGTFNVTFIQQ